LPLDISLHFFDETTVRLLPVLQVQRAIRPVFERFDCLGSAQTVLLFFRRHELELPRHITIRSGS
jgi:hypothetical protein